MGLYLMVNSKNLDIGIQGHLSTDAIFLPFFTGSFFNLKLDRQPSKMNLNDTGSDAFYELIVKQGKYDGHNGFIECQGSSSIFISGSTS